MSEHTCDDCGSTENVQLVEDPRKSNPFDSGPTTDKNYCARCRNKRGI